MECPSCKYHTSHVTDSGRQLSKEFIRRRRKCLRCDHRWNTFEITEAEHNRILSRSRDLDSIAAALNLSITSGLVKVKIVP